MTAPSALPWITLTTDFGHCGPYVGALKGVILSYWREARVVDITHEIPPQDIATAALVVADSTPYFPPGTIHVVVVDPGVGTDRALLYAEIGSWRYLAPDNGVLTLVYKKFGAQRVLRLTEPRFWRPQVSATFHGRDILAPVAAQLAQGLDPAQLGPPWPTLQLLDWPLPRLRPGEIVGQVICLDTFGNLITNVHREDLLRFARPEDFSQLEIELAGRKIRGIGATYGLAPPGQLVALLGSSDRLEIAVVCGSAAQVLGVGPGCPVILRR